MTPGAVNTVEWPTSGASLLFLFNFPSLQSSCLKTNKQNTAKSWAVFTFGSFHVFPGDNYLASCPCARALCVYMVRLRVCWLPIHNWPSLNEPRIMMATKMRQASRQWLGSKPSSEDAISSRRAMRPSCLEARRSAVVWKLWFVAKRTIKLVWGFM